MPRGDVFIRLASPGVSAGQGEDGWSITNEISNCLFAVADHVLWDSVIDGVHSAVVDDKVKGVEASGVVKCLAN